MTLVWTTASVEPTTSVSTATTQITGCQSSTRLVNPYVITRISAANPATFAADAMNAVTGVGAPWYTSGVHVWNGTAAILNRSPTSRSAIPASNKVFVLPRNTVLSSEEKIDSSPAGLDVRCVVPVAP